MNGGGDRVLTEASDFFTDVEPLGDDRFLLTRDGDGVVLIRRGFWNIRIYDPNVTGRDADLAAADAIIEVDRDSWLASMPETQPTVPSATIQDEAADAPPITGLPTARQFDGPIIVEIEPDSRGSVSAIPVAEMTEPWRLVGSNVSMGETFGPEYRFTRGAQSVQVTFYPGGQDGYQDRVGDEFRDDQVNALGPDSQVARYDSGDRFRFDGVVGDLLTVPSTASTG